jgi:hypothetical protein
VRPLGQRCSSVALLSIAISSTLLTACSSSNSPSGFASSQDRSRGLCSSITPAEVEAITGNSVGAPASVLQGKTTECSYGAANPSHRVAIGYTTSATASSFTEKRDAIVNLGSTVTAVSGVGEEAFVYGHTVGATTSTTVVARQGTVMVMVTGTAATPDQVEALAQKALERAG